MNAANQHIEIDGGVLRKQSAFAREWSAAFGGAAAAIRPDLPADAFGRLSQGLVAPFVDALAVRARDLLSCAHDLAERIADGVDHAAAGFTAVEQDAVDTFTRGDT